MKFSKSIFLLFFPAVSFAQNKTMTFSGHLANMQDLSSARLRFDSDSVRLVSDSVAIINGDFSFEGTVSYPVLADLVIEVRKPGAHLSDGFYERYLYLEPGKIDLRSGDSLKNVTIKGSALNNDFIRFQSAIKPASDKISALKKEYYSASKGQLQSDSFQQRIREENTRLEEDFRKLQLEFVGANPGSLVSLDALISYSGEIPDPNKIGSLFHKLSAGLKNSPKGKKLEDEIEKMRTTAVGSQAPDFTLPDTSGKAVSLHDFRGKYVLIDFWASWCGPCRKENPNVVKNYNIFKEKGFAVLGVSLDRQNGKTAWLDAIKNDGLAWTQVSDLKFWDSEAAKKYNITAIPQNFMIDPSGRIIARDLRGKDLEDKLKELFKN